MFGNGTLASAQQKAMERTLYRTIVFNRALQWEYSDDVALATDVDTLMEIYALRSRVYKMLGYDKEFPEIIEGMNFDRYDEHAAVLYVRKHGEVTATCRVIFDEGGRLPIDKYYSLDDLRSPHVQLAELSGGFEQKAQLSVYGDLQKPFVITAWDISRISPFFKRLFLGMRT